MKITSSEPKDYVGISGKGLITSLGLKTIGKSNEIKKARYVVTSFRIKDLSKMINTFEMFLIRVMFGRGPNMNPLTVTFI